MRSGVGRTRPATGPAVAVDPSRRSVGGEEPVEVAVDLETGAVTEVV